MASKVVGGDYEGKLLVVAINGAVRMSLGLVKYFDLNKDTVDHYEVIDETSLTTGKKSAVSAVGRAFVGGALLGPAGLLAGVTAKTKYKTQRDVLVAVQFKDGKQSLIQFDDKTYKQFVKKVF